MLGIFLLALAIAVVILLVSEHDKGTKRLEALLAKEAEKE